MKGSNLILIALVILLTVFPLVVVRDAEFPGADAQAEDAITEIRPDYKPWFSPIFEPPSGEIESLLFAAQAALGASVLAYFFGYKHGLRKGKQEKQRVDASD
ncbi:MAG: energy-coupling factor ABC transporter substrate-binding protein [Thermoflexales bacterium]|nr:energy-coupling factor ABC transporter substrate-binding protein [Thermoflexales bacterium]MDW8352080.1 energy-coupling factor ABC transporter substrate-binding protein [Anaerolineae bacterium]